MAFDHPIFDPEENRTVLLDHLFLISAGDITKAAKHWLAEQLDASQRRQIVFMGRDELLDHAAKDPSRPENRGTVRADSGIK